MHELSSFICFSSKLNQLNINKLLINTINAHSFNVTQKDIEFADVLQKSDVLLPDGISIVMALKWLTGESIKKIAGDDLFFYEMERLQKISGKCFFLGSSESILNKIKERAEKEYPNVTVETYSPPFKKEFSDEENEEMINAVNAFQPDVLFVGMTAPKQEKWAYKHFSKLNAGHVCCIGAVFDFYAGTITRAPKWMINIGLEWLYRLLKEPKRMWRRYIIGNTLFICYIIREKIYLSKNKNLLAQRKPTTNNQ